MINDRIKEIRRALGVTQQSFSEMLGVKRNTVAQWELGINGLSEPVIKAICSEFGVNEEWFRTGCGEMFIRTDMTPLEKLFQELNANYLEAAILRAYFRIDPHVRERFLRSLLENAEMEIPIAAERKDALWNLVSAGQPAAEEPAPPPPETDSERADRLAREKKELLDENATLKKELAQLEKLEPSHIPT